MKIGLYTNNKCTDVSQVLSESMELDKKDESLIFVNKMLSSVKNGDIYVVRVKEEVFIKLLKLKMIKLHLYPKIKTIVT